MRRSTIVVASTFTADPLADAVEYWAKELDLPVDVRFAAYNQVFQELLDPSSLLGRNRSGIDVVALRLGDWDHSAAGGDHDGVEAKVEDFVDAVTSFSGRAPVPLLIVVCPSDAGGTSGDDDRRRRLGRAEGRLVSGLTPLVGVHVVGSRELIERYDLDVIEYEATAAHGHVPYTPPFYAALGTELVRKLRAAYTPPVKVLALDCDQTLWTGVVGEDGPLGVKVDSSRRALQQFALARRSEGVLLCLCTKNAEEDVLEVLDNHPEMVLRREHFAAWRIDWSRKSESIRSLAQELGLGVDSFVLLDDSPLECAEVSLGCPGVLALTLPSDAHDIAGFLAGCWAFDRLSVTQADADRAAFYEQSAAREALRAGSLSFGTFIASLSLEVRFFEPAAEHLARVAQLTQRTNQFNSTTIRRTEQDLSRELASGEVKCIAVDVRDRFGDYGLVGVALYRERDGALWIESLLLSCRALGRGVEHRLLAHIGEIALARDLEHVRIPFASTSRNHPVLQFLLEIADGGHDGTEAETVFRLPASEAARVHFDPMSMGPADEPDHGAEVIEAGRPASSPFQLDAAQLEAVAATAGSAHDISARLVNAAQARARDLSRPYVAPQSETERLLAGLWAETLQLDRVGIFDDFFELGGSSLQATLLVNRLQDVLGRPFDSIVVFDASTVASLAQLVEESEPVHQPSTGTPRVTAVRGERSGPLSPAQERLWFLDQLNPGNPVYNERRAIRLRGSLQVDVLKDAVNDLVARHESLRTTFPAVDGQPEQRVVLAEPLPLEVSDFSPESEEAREAAAMGLVADEAARPFDLEVGPLFRAGLVRLAPDDHVLWLVFHHIVADGSSVGILLRELGELYRARLAGEPKRPLPVLEVQYLDFAVRQRDHSGDERLVLQRSYWRKMLAELPVLELPADRARPPILTYRGSSVPVSVPRELVQRLRRVGQSRQATLFMTLLAAFQVLLARYSRQDEVVVGFPVAGRRQPDADGVVGFFVNTLPLRVDLSGNPSFDEALRTVRERALEAYMNQDVPFQQLVEDLVPERDLSRTPIFQAMLALLDDPVADVDVPGVSASSFRVPVSTARFDLVLNLEEGESGLIGGLEYSTDLFDSETADRMVGHLLTLLEGIAASPSTPILELPLLTAGEEARILGESAGGTARFDVTDTLHDRFAVQVARTPSATAVSCEGSALSYGELNARANQLAYRLQRLGVAPDTLVGLCVDRSLDLVVGILGILKAGGAYLPLDPTYPTERLRILLEDSEVAIVVGQEEQLRVLPPSQATVVKLDTDADEIAREPKHNPESRVGPHNLAYVIYTSGSTGKPKGVPITHANVARLFDATDTWFGFDSSDIWTLFHSFAFDFSVWELWGALLHGGRLVVVPYWVSRSPQAFHELLRNECVTVLNQTPSAFSQLIQADQTSGVESGEMSLRYVVFGGEALDLQSLVPWFERYQDTHPRLVNMYGITETTVHVTYRPIVREDVECAAGSLLGVPIPDLELYLVNPALQPVPVGVPGEICVGGAGVARGYLNRPDLTAARFLPNPFRSASGRLYRSGDLARRLPNGDLEYLGRIDHQVKIRGFRIELGEIEAAIAQHPNVRQVAVVDREDTPGEKKLVAYLVADAPPQTLIADLRDAICAHLPDYMRPAHFLYLDALPLTPNGKLDRKALPAPEHGRAESGRRYIAPRNPAEETIADVWKAVLRVERVGVDDHFFELGGDSLLCIRVHAQLRDKLRADLPVVALLQYPTVRTLARHLAGEGNGAASTAAMDRARKQREAYARQRNLTGRR